MKEISTAASLRISTDESALDFVTETLGVAPIRQHILGERRSPRNPQSSTFEQSIWIYESPLPDSAELHEHIESILTLLEARMLAMDKIRGRISGIDVFCKFSSENGQGSAELKADLLRRLADQRIDLLIDLYPPS